MEKILEVEKHGYKLFVIVDSERNNFRDVVINSNDKLANVHVANYNNLIEKSRKGKLDEIDFSISTASIGSHSVERIKEVINEYQEAIEAVECFKEALSKLERSV